MKKIFFYILLFFMSLFSFGLNISANNSTITIWWDKIFDTKPTNPYCSEPGDCSLKKWIDETKWKIHWIEKNWTAVSYIQWVISYILSFLFLVTVLIIIWAWFTILTSAWNDDKVDSAKKIIKNSIIWLIVIFLAYPISSFIVWTFEKAKTSDIKTNTTP